MKNTRAFIPVLFIFLLAACNDDSITVAPADQATHEIFAYDISEIDQYIADVDDHLELLGVIEANATSVATRGPDCPTIVFEKPRGEYPNTITVDFGTGCTGPHGHIVSGVVVISMSDDLRNEGAEHSTTFDGLTVDSVVFDGNRTRINLNVDESGNTSISRTVDVSAAFPSGETAHRSSNRVRTQTAGGDTRKRLDDVFEISGSGEGAGRNGTTYASAIEQPLLRSGNCRWVTAGVIRVSRTNDTELSESSIDFSAPDPATCDNLAVVTLPDGTEKQIRLGRRR